MRIVVACAEAASSVIDHIVDLAIPFMEAGLRVVVAVPHPPFDDLEADGADLVGRKVVKNALPIAYRAWLSAAVGADVDLEIVQMARVGRSKLAKFPRFLYQPAFTGYVDKGAAYILADDVFTIGGTLAALRSYIIGQNGTVVLSTTLAHSSGKSQQLAPLRQTCDELVSLFGPGFDNFWVKEIGHASNCLTEAECRLLVRWSRGEGRGRSGEPLLQFLRDRLFEAAAKGE